MTCPLPLIHEGFSIMGNCKHGMTKSPEYVSWAQMKSRCLKNKSTRYKDYGGRGITVCDRWLNSFENFYEDMGDRPSKNHSLDRIDVNGNYEPSNCRWADNYEQGRNQRIRIDNSSSVKGVHWVKAHKTWRARISVNGKRVLLGDYKVKKEAIKARREAELKYWNK